MEILASLEDRAARIPDGIEKLTFLRRSLERRRRRFLTVSLLGLTVAAVASFNSSGTAKPVPIHPPTAIDSQPKLAPLTPQSSRALEPVWVAEQRDDYALYSNGLQIRTDYLTPSVARRYRAFSRTSLSRSEFRTVPAGIVYHTTESPLLPLEAARSSSLLQTREEMLRHVQRNKLYNFVVDRYGVVFRIVAEDQVAHHAGHSVWADAKSVYVDLNESFIGIAFEARTGLEPRTGEAFEPTAAQMRSGRLLTDLIRSTYSIPESSCVTHAQVSVNPGNMRFGYHTDWAAKFPFREFGLSSGYSTSVPAVEIFGFDYDQTFLHDIGGQAWDGLAIAERRILAGAQQRGTTPAAYRSSLQKQYRSLRSLNYDQAFTAANRT